MDGYSAIQIKESSVNGAPRNNSILASINGHTLTVTFTENLGNVQIDITTATGGAVSYGHVWTPDSYIRNPSIPKMCSITSLPSPMALSQRMEAAMTNNKQPIVSNYILTNPKNIVP